MQSLRKIRQRLVSLMLFFTIVSFAGNAHYADAPRVNQVEWYAAGNSTASWACCHFIRQGSSVLPRSEAIFLSTNFVEFLRDATTRTVVKFKTCRQVYIRITRPIRLRQQGRLYLPRPGTYHCAFTG